MVNLLNINIYYFYIDVEFLNYLMRLIMDFDLISYCKRTLIELVSHLLDLFLVIFIIILIILFIIVITILVLIVLT